MIHNILSIDVEDYIHAGRIAKYYPPDILQNAPSCLGEGMKILLDILTQHNIKATFFCLGDVARLYPQMIKNLAAQGHEIASHSLSHIPVYQQTASEFYNDCLTTRHILQDMTGQPIKGYRAPSFSINQNTPFFYDMLIKAGYTYSSSLHPIAHDHYGDKTAPRFAFHPVENHSFLEIPISTLCFPHFPKQRIPIGGGGWFRIMPYTLYRWFVKQHHAQGDGLIFYTHPWEFVHQHGLYPLGKKDAFLHQVGLKKMPCNFAKLISDISWTSFEKGIL